MFCHSHCCLFVVFPLNSDVRLLTDCNLSGWWGRAVRNYHPSIVLHWPPDGRCIPMVKFWCSRVQYQSCNKKTLPNLSFPALSFSVKPHNSTISTYFCKIYYLFIMRRLEYRPTFFKMGHMWFSSLKSANLQEQSVPGLYHAWDFHLTSFCKLYSGIRDQKLALPIPLIWPVSLMSPSI